MALEFIDKKAASILLGIDIKNLKHFVKAGYLNQTKVGTRIHYSVEEIQKIISERELKLSSNLICSSNRFSDLHAVCDRVVKHSSEFTKTMLKRILNIDDWEEVNSLLNKLISEKLIDVKFRIRRGRRVINHYGLLINETSFQQQKTK